MMGLEMVVKLLAQEIVDLDQMPWRAEYKRLVRFQSEGQYQEQHLDSGSIW
jgi:hypothetical protein